MQTSVIVQEQFNKYSKVVFLKKKSSFILNHYINIKSKFVENSGDKEIKENYAISFWSWT